MSQEVDRGTKAKAVLDSQIYQESYEMVRNAIIERIEKCPLSDTQVAEDLRRCLKLLRDVRLNLETAVNTGKIAQFNLSEIEARRANPLRHLFR